MGEARHSYIRLMTDIIDSGVWAELSHAAKTLYPVLLKFSDYHFKPVWPSTETLLKLTGFKTKKSLVMAKKELTKVGLLYHVPGGGRTSTRYHFSFHYPGSKITPLGDTGIPLRDGQTSSSAGENPSSEGHPERTPNHINITIRNTNQIPETKTSDREKESRLEEWIQLFGPDIAMAAYEKARRFQMEHDPGTMRSLCREILEERKLSNFKQSHSETATGIHPASWQGFLVWAAQELTPSTWKVLESALVTPEGNILVVETFLPPHLKQIVQMYFTEKAKPNLYVVFAQEEELSRLKEIR